MNQPVTASPVFSLRAPGWTMAATVFAIAVIVLLACYWSTVASLVWVWGHDGTYQYAFLIFPLSAWVAFTLRDQLRANVPTPSVWGLLAVTALVFVWYAGHLLAINLLQHFALVALFPALVLACWGWRAIWVLAFPLGYLVVFAVPWGDSMVGPLQDITAHMAVRALELTGTPALLNGREILTPSATWMVEQACSGVRFFIACTALGCLYAYLMYLRWWKRILFVLLAAVVPIVANGLRVYFTVLIGETWGLHYATGTDHMIFGWQFFGTVLVLLLLSGWFFRDRLVARERPVLVDSRYAGARSMVWPAAIAVLVAGPLAAATLAPPPSPENVRLTAPAVAGWNGTHVAVDGWQPSFSGAAGQLQASYRSEVARDRVAALYHAVYTGRPRQGHSLVAYGNDVYDPAKSRILSQSHVRVDLLGGRSTTAGELRLAGKHDGASSRLVWYWYCVDQRCTRWPVWIKLLETWDVLRGRAPRSSVWAISAPITSNDIEQARTSLRAFARSLPATSASAVPAREAADVSGPQP
jgi:exosortase A